jgi:anthranilate phosphoribosyltransferase
LLLALREKGEAVEEIAGAAAALRQHMTRIHSRRDELLDTCGTGGDGTRTFNISTAAALVAAAAGVAVAKHGNRRITSACGSADVLAALGVNIEAGSDVVERCLDELGICFCFAPQLHPAMKRVAAIRRALGVPTVFNLLGPLSNPAGAPYQLLGVGRGELRGKLAHALQRLGARRAAVVSGRDGMDEVTLADATDVHLVEGDQVQPTQWTPEDFGVDRADRAALLAATPDESAALIRRVLLGEAGPPRDIVVANAAAGLWLARREPSLRQCAERAREAIDSRAAAELLDRLVEFTQG